MSRIFTQLEATAFAQAEPELRAAGLDVDDPKNGAANADLVASFFDQNPQASVTVQSIRAAVFGVLKDKLVWKSLDEVEFAKVWVTLTSLEQGNFNSWQRPARLINNLRNNLAVLRYLKESQHYPVDAHYLELASTQRIAPQLEWEFAPRIDPRQHKSDGSFMPKDSDPNIRAGRRNHAYQEPSKQEAPKTNAPVDAWETMAKNMLGYGSHSQQIALKQVFDQARAAGKEWRQVYAELTALKRNYEKVTNSRGV
jgi:hypothetical protein